MRIINQDKLTDYYDCMQSLGQDKTCTWIRQVLYLQYLDCDNLFKNELEQCSLRELKSHISYSIIGFCGELHYAGIVYDFHNHKNIWMYDVESVSEYAKSNAAKSFIVNKFNSLKNSDHWFQKLGCPIFIATTNGIWLHCTEPPKSIPGLHSSGYKIRKPSDYETKTGSALLKNIGFNAIHKAPQAFSMIHSYLASGIIGFNSPKVPEIDDLTISEAKGFDKYSFRKQKAK